MKPFQKKLVFGIVLIAFFLVGLGITLMADNARDLLVAQIFIVGFIGGIIYWLYINNREAKKVKKERDNRK